MKREKKTKRLWNDTNIEVAWINGRYYALNGWNGYEYTDCWRTDSKTYAIKSDTTHYIIRPIYDLIDDDEYIITDYEIV